MSLKVKVLSGPLIGAEIPLKDGLKFGRTKGDVVLDDSRVSSLHAYVREETRNIFTLHDNGSKNGIRLGTERRDKLKLEVGVRFHIGISEFEVITDNPAETSISVVSAVDLGQLSEDLAVSEHLAINEAPTAVAATKLVQPLPQKTENPPESFAEPSPSEPAQEARRWNQVLEGELLDLAPQFHDQPKTLFAFDPAVQLTFIGGLQVETKWLLGYGPRQVGAASVDLPILEPQSPDRCFELKPTKGGVTFVTSHPKRVLLNGREIYQQNLKTGDVISIGRARIEVELIK